MTQSKSSPAIIYYIMDETHRILVPKRPPKRLAEVLRDPIHADASHGPDREGPDERIRIVRVLHERVDGQQCQLRLALGVIDEIQVHQLLQFDVPRLDAVQHVREQARHVLPHGHGRDDLLHGVDLHEAVGRVQLETQFVHLALLLGREEAGVGPATGGGAGHDEWCCCFFLEVVAAAAVGLPSGVWPSWRGWTFYGVKNNGPRRLAVC
jgi:hypothetical protein